MAEGVIQLPPDSSGSKLRTETHTEGANTVHQEVITLAKADGTLFDTTNPVPVNDDMGSFEAQHVTLAGSTDTTITFAQPVRMIHVKNWDTSNRVLVKDGAITSDNDSTASRVGIAPIANVPGTDWFPFATTTVHLRSSGGNEVTIEAYY